MRRFESARGRVIAVTLALSVVVTPILTTGLLLGSEGPASAMAFTGTITCVPVVDGVLYPPRYNTAPATAHTHYLYGGSATGTACNVTQGGWQITGGIIREVNATVLARNCATNPPIYAIKFQIFWEAIPVSTSATSASYPAPSAVALVGGIQTVSLGADVITWTSGSVTGSFPTTTPSMTANFDQLVVNQATECASPAGWHDSTFTGVGPNGASTMTV